MEYQTKEQLFEAYMRHKINSINAIEILEKQFEMPRHEAEALVEAWSS